MFDAKTKNDSNKTAFSKQEHSMYHTLRFKLVKKFFWLDSSEEKKFKILSKTFDK